MLIDQLESERLVLLPLDESAAAEMVGVLADPVLYLHTGGEPPDLETLKARYYRQARGRSPDGKELWLNWIVRTREPSAAVGYVQVTLSLSEGVADVAWVIGTVHQRRGYASEAAAAVLEWLEPSTQVRRITAHIADRNLASQGVARRLGFVPTGEFEHGEQVWCRRGAVTG
jgi:RimJ/RimL family protein N-acetyltransferase